MSDSSASAALLRGASAVLAFVVLTNLPADASSLAAGQIVRDATPQEFLVADPPVHVITTSALYTATPEIAFDRAGNLVMRYVNTTVPAPVYLAKLAWPLGGFIVPPWNATSSSPRALGSQSDWGNSLALDSKDRIIIAYNSVPTWTSYFKVFDANGTAVVNETRLGTVGPSPDDTLLAMAMGTNDSMVFVRSYEVTGGSRNWRVIFDKYDKNGTAEVTNLTLASDADWFRGVQVYPDLARGRFLATYLNVTGFTRILALAENGSTLWGPVSVGTDASEVGGVVAPDGTFSFFWGNGTDLRGATLASNGSITAAPRTVIAGRTTAVSARALLRPNGLIALVWSDLSLSGTFNIFAAEVNASTLTPVRGPVNVGQSTASKYHPREVATPEGDVLVCWSETDIACARLRHDRGGFSVRAPSALFDVVRGEALEVEFNVTSNASYASNYTVSAAYSRFQGPSNWSVELLDPATRLPVGFLPLGPNETATVVARLVPPLADPAGQVAQLDFAASDQRYPSVAATLSINATVIVGHNLTMAPQNVNATANPGEEALLNFTLRNDGVVGEMAPAAYLTGAPPPGWIAAILPSNFSVGPGGTQNLTVGVTIPSDATSDQLYCARLRIDSTSDPFVSASAGFCVATALLSQPELAPLEANGTLRPGESLSTAWNLTNRGNAGAPMACQVALTGALPSGWSVLGNPSALALRGNASGLANLTIVAPADALGGAEFLLAVQGSCSGAPSVAESTLRIQVAVVESFAWRNAGATFNLDSNGSAWFNVSGENHGNVPEPVSVTAVSTPPGWVVAWALQPPGQSGTEIAAFSSSSVEVRVQAAPRTPAGSYAVVLAFAAGSAGSATFSYTAKVARSAGVSLALENATASAGAGGTLAYTCRVENLGNVADAFALQATVASSQIWTWTAQFAPAAPGQGQYVGGSIALDAFANGTLVVSLSIPREPTAGEYVLRITLSSGTGASASAEATAVVLLPQLSVQVVAVPSGTAGPMLAGFVELNVKNEGSGASAPTAVQVQLDGADLGLFNVSGLPAGGNLTLRVPVEVAAGDHSLVARVDPASQLGSNPLWGSVFESVESDNEASASFQIAGAGGPSHGQTAEPSGTVGGGQGLVLLVAAGAGGAGVLAAVWFWRRKRKSP